MKKKIAFIATTFALPLIAFAQVVTSVQSGAAFVINMINSVGVPLLFSLAFFVFIFGIFQYFILSRGNEEAQQTGRNFMIYGLVGFFLMLSVWGLVNILTGSIGLNSNVPNYPTAPHTQ
jgi:hypothetical protein